MQAMSNSPKFAKTDFSKAEVECWTPDHIECGRGFQCRREEFQEYWFNQMATDVAGHVNRVWVIREEGNLAAYITLSTDSLQRKVKGKRKSILKSEGITYVSLPAIKIGRLASDYEAKKSGARLVDWALSYIAEEIAPKVGVRFVTVDALFDADDEKNVYDISKFYEKFGFQFVDPDEKLTTKTPYRSMFLDIKPLVDAFEAMAMISQG